MRVSGYLQAAFLASIILAVTVFGPVRPVFAVSNTPTFVLGVTNPTDPLILDLQNLTSSLTVLGSVSSLSLVSTNSILFIDGSWLATQSSLAPTVLSLITAKVMAGVPTVTVRGNPTLLSSSISGLLEWHAQGLPLISEGLWITGSLPDGTKISSVLQVISGFDYAVQAEFTWASNLLALGSAGFTASAVLHRTGPKMIGASSNTTTPAAPYWEHATTFRIDTGNGYAPYGRIISTFVAYQLENSGSSKYGWYNLFFNQTIQPGIMIYNSDWRTAREYQIIHVLNTTSTMLVDHGPNGVVNSGPFVVNYNTGVYAGVLGAVVNSTQSQSYALKHTNVTDASQPPDVSWIHTIDARTTAGTLTFQVIPGSTTRYLLGSKADISLGVSTTFVELQGNSLVGSTTLTYGVFPA